LARESSHHIAQLTDEELEREIAMPLANTYPIAASGWPLSHNVTASRVNVEKVVNPPMRPVVRNNRASWPATLTDAKPDHEAHQSRSADVDRKRSIGKAWTEQAQ
jgi:hypothetical protein